MNAERCRKCRRISRPPLDKRAFTLVELLVVISLIAILASLLMPALNKTTVQARGAQCRNNPRQLTMAWLMYADDNAGRLAPNLSDSVNSWVGGIMTFDTPATDCTNTQKLLDPAWAKLGPYVQAADSFRCPSDRSSVVLSGVRYSRVRSYAMNAAVGFQGGIGNLPFNPGWMAYKQSSDLTRPGPYQVWVFTEEHPDSIDDCVFRVDCQNQGNTARFISVPANYHDGAASFSFADGHVEMYRLKDERSKLHNKYCGCISSYAHNGYYTETPNNPDVAWLQAHTSVKVRPY
jgi:prepilin-type N-terminal cleavage/methylation domain-containing protein/prepilin-type processing-associated H-X9-DG protein